MFSNILFLLYVVFISCAVPISVGVNHGYKQNKSNWAQSVFYVATRQTELICLGDNNCFPLQDKYGAGTSFVIDYIGGRTIMMSAAHLCEPYIIEPEGAEESIPLKIIFEIGIIQGDFLLLVDNILYVDRETDICVFSVPVELGVKIEISKKPPKYGENVWSIGAPTGYFPETAKPITHGLFSGDAERRLMDGGLLPFSNFNMPTVPGMSGSPIINKKGDVVGLVSAVSSEWHMISYSPTLKQLRDARDIALIKLNQ
jgi:hypothetical protein